MNCRVLITLFLLLLSSILIKTRELNAQERPSVGLVLSGGGAKGFAHIGVLKMLDSLDIPIDYIAGTSMGGIMGAFYSIGYSGIEIEELVKGTDWEEIFSDLPPRREQPHLQKKDDGNYQIRLGLKGMKPFLPSGMIYGQKISLLFSRLTFPFEKVKDFDELPIQYRCIAVDIATGQQIVLKKGSLAEAMRSTMAIPTVFSPVEWGDSLLVDGGMVNNLPVDIVKEMGADIVIAVDVGVPLLDREKLNSAVAILNQSIAMLGIDRWKANIEQTDLLITPEIDAFTPADFREDKVEEIVLYGDKAAADHKEKLIRLQERYSLYKNGAVKTRSSGFQEKQINVLAIKGNIRISHRTLRKNLNIKAGKPFLQEDLDRRIARMKMAGAVEEITYKVLLLDSHTVNVIVNVFEKKYPVIHGISITGNERLPFTSIYNMLGLKPNDELDTNDLSRRIMRMYGLGYFENIKYEIEPRGDNYVHLIVKIKELPRRQLQVGLFYDNQHQLVASVNVRGVDLLIPGLRAELDWQFAGLAHRQYKLYYPLRSLGLPLYPFFRTIDKSIPADIFSYFDGSHMARYRDKSNSNGVGLGVLLSNSSNLEIEYQHEVMNVNPKISSDPTLFPKWNEELKKFNLTLRIDLIDNIILPRRGILIKGRYEGSLKSLNSELTYQLADLSADLYVTLFEKHTFRFFGYKGIAENIPNYKYFHIAAPHTYAGMESDALFGHHISIARIDYRYQVKNNLFVKLIANTAFDLDYRGEYELWQDKPRDIWGVGAGIKIITPIGPFECIYTYGDKTFSPIRKKQTLLFFTFGASIGRTIHK